MAVKKSARKAAAKSPAPQIEPDYTQVMKDLHAVLRKHGIGGRISTMAFAGEPPCRCPDGRPGVLRVVGRKLICVCD